jgi:hypothetical protein
MRRFHSFRRHETAIDSDLKWYRVSDRLFQPASASEKRRSGTGNHMAEDDQEQQGFQRASEAMFMRAWQTQTERHGIPTCTICAGQEWFFYTSLLLPTSYIGQSMKEDTTNKAYVAQFACRRCGYLLYFDAVTLVGDSFSPT